MRAILSQVVGEVGAETNVALDGRILAPALDGQATLSQSSPVSSNTLVVNWISDTRTGLARTNVQPTYPRYAPALIVVDVLDTTGFLANGRHWDVTYTWGDTSNILIQDPDPTGVRTSARGTNVMDLATDLRGFQGCMLFTNAGTYTLSINALTTNGSNLTYTTNVVITNAVFSNTVQIGSSGAADTNSWTNALATWSGNNINFRFERGQTHAITSQTGGAMGSRSNILVSAATNAGATPILRLDHSNGVILTSGGNQVRVRDLEFTGGTGLSYNTNATQPTQNSRGLIFGTGARNSVVFDCVVNSRGINNYTTLTDGSLVQPLQMLNEAAGSNNFVQGCAAIRVVRHTSNGWNSYSQPIRNAGFRNCFYLGCVWDQSRQEDCYRHLYNLGLTNSDGSANRGMTLAWNYGNMGSLGGGNANKTVFRFNGGDWVWAQENRTFGAFNPIASDGGSGAGAIRQSRNIILDGNYCGATTNALSDVALSIGMAGSNLVVRNNLVRGNPTNSAFTTEHLEVQGQNNGSDGHMRGIDWYFNTWVSGPNYPSSQPDGGWNFMQANDHGSSLRSNEDLRGNLFVGPDSTVGDATNHNNTAMAGGSGNDWNQVLSNAQDNVYPTDATLGNFATDGGAGSPYVNLSDWQTYLGSVSSNEQSEAHSVTNLLADATNGRWEPGASEGTVWRTNATPFFERVQRDYTGQLRVSNGATNVWSVGAIAVTPT